MWNLWSVSEFEVSNQENVCVCNKQLHYNYQRGIFIYSFGKEEKEKADMYMYTSYYTVSTTGRIRAIWGIFREFQSLFISFPKSRSLNNLKTKVNNRIILQTFGN